MSVPRQNLQIVAQGLARLTTQFVAQANIRAMLAVYLQPFQDLENAVWAVMNARILASALLLSPPSALAAGTASVTNGSTLVTFSSAQSLSQGMGVVFGSQPGAGYVFATPVTGTTGTLTVPYFGPTNAATTIAPLLGNIVFDELGALVGQPRYAMSDHDYKAMIYLRAAVNRATGRTPDWSKFGSILLQNAGGPVSYYRGGDASFFFGVWDLELNPQIVAQALSAAVPNGVYGLFGYSTWADGNDFEWCDVNNVSSTGQGTWGDSVAGVVGGLLVSGASI